MRFLLMTNPNKPKAVEVTRRVARLLHSIGDTVCGSSEMAEVIGAEDFEVGEYNAQLERCDVVVAVGGDGTIFHCAKQAAMADKPIIGVNAGHLGFLSQIESDALDDLKLVAQGHYDFQRRMLLEIEARHGDCTNLFYAINDCVISRSNLGSIAEIGISCDGVLVGDYRADGVIFSTPTGSTAYSLSAGGPIVDPSINCLIMTPICPHSMYDRSILFSPDKVLVSRPLFDGRQEVLHLIADGERVCDLRQGAEVHVRCSQRPVLFIDLKKRTFYQIINQKLRLRG